MLMLVAFYLMLVVSWFAVFVLVVDDDFVIIMFGCLAFCWFVWVSTLFLRYVVGVCLLFVWFEVLVGVLCLWVDCYLPVWFSLFV